MDTSKDWGEHTRRPDYAMDTLPTGEAAPIVSSCAVCERSLRLHEMTVMSDGQHLCLSDHCETVYRNAHIGEDVVFQL